MSTYQPHAGDRVRVRRYQQPHLDRPDGRELEAEYTGIVKDIRYWPGQTQIFMDEAEGGFFCPEYVFFGGDPRDGTCRYLVTEIEPALDTDRLAEAIVAAALDWAGDDPHALDVAERVLRRTAYLEGAAA